MRALTHESAHATVAQESALQCHGSAVVVPGHVHELQGRSHVAGAVLMVCATLKARGVKEASVLNLGSLHESLPKPASQTGMLFLERPDQGSWWA